MIFTSLAIENLGVYRGAHSFDLRPKSTKPIIIFGGKNGRGKTTLFESIPLCLYGSWFSGKRLTNSEYEKSIRERIHRSRELLVQPNFASVTIEFEYGKFGEVEKYSVKRSWYVSETGVKETLSITKNGKDLEEIEAEQWQSFLKELIPPRLSTLFFFDGERITGLAEDKDNDGLGEAFGSLLGLELVERLQTDLKILISKNNKDRNTVADNTVETLENEKQKLVREKEKTIQKRAQKQAFIERVSSEIEKQETKIASEGGGYATKRGELKAKSEALDKEIAEAEEKIRSLCSSILPFCLAPNLCNSLVRSLENEEEYQRLSYAKEFVISLVPKIESSFNENKALSKNEKKYLISKIKDTIDKELHNNFFAEKGAHNLSGPQLQRIQSSIKQSLTDAPSTLISITKDLEAMTRDRQEIISALSRIPSDEVLSPLVKKLTELHQECGQLFKESSMLADEIKSLDFKITEIDRKLNKLFDQNKNQGKLSRNLILASKSLDILNEYEIALRKHKIGELSNNLLECFNALSNKEGWIEKIEIDPKLFSIMLHERGGKMTPKERISAGEKQMYAIAMLWALAKSSGKPLPFILDTPLAKLDSDHRHNLVTKFFPKASHQVIIFSTDTEVDKQYFSELKPFISHSYHLQFDNARGLTIASKGYFWEDHSVQERKPSEMPEHNKTLVEVTV